MAIVATEKQAVSDGLDNMTGTPAKPVSQLMNSIVLAYERTSHVGQYAMSCSPFIQCLQLGLSIAEAVPRAILRDLPQHLYQRDGGNRRTELTISGMEVIHEMLIFGIGLHLTNWCGLLWPRFSPITCLCHHREPES